MVIEENVALSTYTTMRAGGTARFFVRAAKASDLSEALDFAKEKSLPIFILGGGSNTIAPDEGFLGLVIKIEIKGITYEETSFGVHVISGAGEVWDSLVCDVVERGLWGVENLSLIPGLVGGAAVQNIGAYGVEICESILWVEAFDATTRTMKTFSRDECAFRYRESLFKKNKHLIITRVAFDLVRNAIPQTSYEDVKKYFTEKGITLPTIAEVRASVIAIRTAKFPPPPLGTAGSFFKNPIVSQEHFEKLKIKFPSIKAYIQRDGTVKVSAAWLLDHVGGWRSVRHGDVGAHDKQALVVVNYGSATSREIISFAREMKESIKEKTNITLEEEVVVMCSH